MKEQRQNSLGDPLYLPLKGENPKSPFKGDLEGLTVLVLGSLLFVHFISQKSAVSRAR